MPTQTFKVGEMLNQRSLFSKTWLNFDGSYTTEVHNNLIHFLDETGDTHNINTDLIDEADLDSYVNAVSKHGKKMLEFEKGKVMNEKKKNKLNREAFDYQAPAVPFSVQIPKNIKKGYSVGENGSFIRFIPINGSPSKGYVSKNKKNEITYQDVWNDTDVLLEVTGRGVKETMILKTDRAPFAFSFEVSGMIEDDLTIGNMKLEPAWLQDAEGTKRDVAQTIRREDEKTFIDLTADVTGLVYPIAIDPTVTIQPDATAGKDAFVDAFAPTVNYGSNQSLFVGNDAGGSTYRSLLEFNLSTIPSGAIVTAGTLTLNGNGTNNSSLSMILNVYRNTQSWTELNVNWNTQPQVITTPVASTTVGTVTTSSVHTFDIKQLISDWVNGVYPNYGVTIRDNDEDMTVYKEFNSSDFATVAERPKLTVTYNTPPTTPTLTSPNGGETWNSTHTVTWLAASDAESSQSTLRYHIQLSTNNGASWKDIVSLTSMGVTSYTYNFINEAETSTAKVRIRSYDGTSYSSWDESNGVFAIVHNVAPTAPTNLQPTEGIFDTARQAVHFTWKHNDPNGTDPQSKFDLQWRLQGSTAWNFVTQNTPNEFWDAAYFPVGVIEWQVRTYDQTGLSGPYSNVAAFTSALTTSPPTITSPADGSSVSVSNPVVQWSHPNQVRYWVRVRGANDVLLWETFDIGANKALTVGINLNNQSTYKIQVAVMDAGGLWSDFATVTVNVSYIAPGLPVIVTTPDNKRGSVELTIKNLTEAGTTPGATKNDVYKWIDNEYVRIEKDLVPTEDFIDTMNATETFAGKVSLSTVENPHIIRYTGSGLIVPWNGAEINTDQQSYYERMSTTDGNTGLIQPGVGAGAQAAIFFSFNLIEVFKRKFGITVPGTTLANKVEWLKKNIDVLSFYWVGYGMMGNNTPGAYMSVYNIAGGAWHEAGAWQAHGATVPTTLSGGINSVSIGSFIDADGFIHYSAAASVSDGVGASGIYTDFVKLEVSAKVSGKKSTFTDYEVRPNETENYIVVTHGDNGTTSDSIPISGLASVEGTQLAVVDDPGEYVTLIKGTKLSKRTKRESEKTQFAGRPYKMTEFGDNKEREYDYSYLVSTWDEVEAIERIAEAGEVLLLRDALGRKEYVTIDEVTVNEGPTHWEINIKPAKVYYVEGV